MKRTLNTAFYQPNNNTDIPDEDTDNEPAPKRVAPTMHVRDSTPDPIAPAGPSPATPIQALGPINQPLFVSRGQATVPQQAPASTQEKSMSGTNVHLAGEDGHTGLMLATQNGDLLTGKTLLFNGANVNITATSLITSMIAALQSQLTTKQALLNAHGVNTDTQNHNGTTALYMAAALGEDDVVKAFIQKGANVNVIANYGWTPLMVAAGRGHLTIVQALLSAPQINIDAKKFDGATALIVAAALDKDDVVKALIDHGANVNITDNYGSTPLISAVADQGHLKTVQALLSAPQIDINTKNIYGANALLLAAALGKDDVVKALITHGANVNITDNYGWTPLMVAAEKGHLTSVQALLNAHSINIDTKKRGGATALFMAAYNSKDDVVKALIQKGANVNINTYFGWTPLMSAAEKGHLTTVQVLLNANSINIDTKNHNGATALYIAAAFGRDDIVKALIQKGANVNITDDDGWAPLMYAAEKGHLTTVQALLNANSININARNKKGRAALYVAAYHGKDDVVKALIQKGANVNIISHDGWTPLMAAADQGHLTIVQALLSAPQIDINAKDISGSNALMVATDRGKGNVVKVLIDHGADVNVTDDQGQTLLMFALKKGRKEIVQTLLSTPQIDINVQAVNGKTALYIAATRDDDGIVKALIDQGADINQIYEYINALVNESSEDSDDEDEEADLTPLDSLKNYLTQRNANAGNLHEEAIWASAFATSVTSPKTIAIPSLQSPEMDTLIEQAQLEGPSLAQISFQAIRDQLLEQKLSATQVVTLIHTIHSNRLATVLVQTLAVAIKLGSYRTDSENQLIHNALLSSRLMDEYEKSKSYLSPDNINRWQVSGQTLLTCAAQAGDQILVNALISCGAAYHLPDQYGNNALHAAVKAGKWSVCSDLLARGANPNSSDRSGVSTLTYLAKAFAKGNEETATIVAKLMSPLLAKGYGLNRVVRDPEALEQRRKTTIMEILRIDLNRFALHLDLLLADNINLADGSGQTPLMFAAKKGHLTTVQALLSVPQIDINAKKPDGVTALIVATNKRKDDVVKALIDHGANVNITDNNGWTPLMFAAEKGHLTTVQALLSAPQIDINAKKTDGVTALIVATNNRKDDVVKALIDHGANVNITDNYGWSPLMFAAEKGHLTIMQALLDKNADTKQTNKAGMTVFNIIERKDSNEMKVRLLELVQKYRT